ncbi:MAG: glycosyl transferase [Phycisphaerales bacterium]|nr:MAG: glycosyl transferase [Phycisphaerales bacterium]
MVPGWMDNQAPRAEPASAPGNPGVLLVEVGYEVCNPIGGIYQVLRSKAATMVDHWDDRYLLVGPYIPEQASLEMEPRRPTGWLARAVAGMEASGVACHCGRWLVPGRPRVVLLDVRLPPERVNAEKFYLWEHEGVDSPSGDEMVDAVIAFGDATRHLMRAIDQAWRSQRPARRQGRRVLAHFHEWMGSMAIPLLKRERQPIATVFTTHATLLGRYLASSEDPPQSIEGIDPQAQADRFGIRARHEYERLAARDCDVMTTISPLTGVECEHLLGRRPEAILPNGLDIGRLSVGHEFQTLHAVFKEKIHHFTMGHFFPTKPIDLDRTLYFFTSGRYEPRNKGFDVFIRASARLNELLAQAHSPTTVVCFIVTRRDVRSIDPVVLQNRAVLDELEDVCEHIAQDLRERLFRTAASEERVSLDALAEEYWMLRLKRTQAAFRTRGWPSVLTHTLEGDPRDDVLTEIATAGLRNDPQDHVKIVYHPQFISPTNPLWGMEYDQFVRGCHLGVFPSIYEPWGYTPLECLALGVPAITTDMSGFGDFVLQRHAQPQGWAPWVLPRKGRSPEQAVEDLAQRMFEFCQLTQRERIRVRNAAEQRSWLFDWMEMAEAYARAHELALHRGPHPDDTTDDDPTGLASDSEPPTATHPS